MLRQRFVLDTTALTDSMAWESEGASDICEGMNAILDRISEGRLHLGVSCYIPYPSVYNEIKDFARHNNCDSRVLGKVDTWLVKKTPDRYKVKVPSKIFYEYVDYMRSRINKGMNISEEAVWESVSRCIALSEREGGLREMKDEIEREVVGSIIRKFREKYRAALRYGILDSAPDIDVLLLAKELDAIREGHKRITGLTITKGLPTVTGSLDPHTVRPYTDGINDPETVNSGLTDPISRY